jgi:hypothetical protein
VVANDNLRAIPVKPVCQGKSDFCPEFVIFDRPKCEAEQPANDPSSCVARPAAGDESSR